MRSYLDALTKYAVFHGRTSRRTYWGFVSTHYVAVLSLTLIPNAEVSALGTMIYGVAVILPCLSVQVRRMHDVGHSGWWAIVPFASMIIACREGERGDNRFGPDPKAQERVHLPRRTSTI